MVRATGVTLLSGWGDKLDDISQISSWELLASMCNHNADDRTRKLVHDSMLERDTDTLGSMNTIQSSPNISPPTIVQHQGSPASIR